MIKGLENLPFEGAALGCSAAAAYSTVGVLSEKFGVPVSFKFESDANLGIFSVQAEWVRDGLRFGAEQSVEAAQLGKPNGPGRFLLLLDELAACCEVYFKPEPRHGH